MLTPRTLSLAPSRSWTPRVLEASRRNCEPPFFFEITLFVYLFLLLVCLACFFWSYKALSLLIVCICSSHSFRFYEFNFVDSQNLSDFLFQPWGAPDHSVRQVHQGWGKLINLLKECYWFLADWLIGIIANCYSVYPEVPWVHYLPIQYIDCF